MNLSVQLQIKDALDVLASGDENIGPASASQAEVDAATYIKCVTSVIKAFLESTSSDIPSALTAAVFELHDNGLIAIPGPLPVQEAVAKLLIDYWSMGCPGAANVIVQLVRCDMRSGPIRQHAPERGIRNCRAHFYSGVPLKGRQRM